MPLTKIKSLGITDGTILGTDVNSTFDLTGKTVTLPEGTGGKVLQVVKTEYSATTQLTSSGAFHELSTNFRLAITPKSSTSILYFEFYAPFVSPNSNQLAYARFYDVTNSSYVNLPTAGGSRIAVHWSKRTTPSDVNDMDILFMKTSVASGSTSARTYTIYHGTEGVIHEFLQTTLSTGSGTNTKPIFIITEVQV